MSDNERSLIGISKIARQKVIERLKFSYANDYLDEIDFERRLEIATNTRDREILKELVDDLPESASAGEAPAARETSFRIDDREAPDARVINSFFSGVTRKGDWHPPRCLKVVAVMGSVDLDFTTAVIPAGGVEIDVFCLMGSLELRVPEGINVEAHPLAVMGSVDNRCYGHYTKGAPTIRVRGLVVMGSVEARPPKKQYLKKFLKKMFTDE